MATVVLKRRNIRILIITILLLGLTLTVLKSTATKEEKTPMNNNDSLREKGSSESNDVSSLKQEQSDVLETSQMAQQATETSSVPTVDIGKEFSEILKRGPLVMFSKTYCPYSRNLKALLSENFEFSPQVVIVELDQHPNGSELQDHIGRVTGRRTVPNLMVNGESKGGFDDFNSKLKSETLYDDFVKWSDSKYSVKKKLSPSSQE